MKKFALTFLLGFFLVFVQESPLMAQADNYKKLLSKGEDLIEEEEYQQALEVLLKAEQAKPKDPKASALISECYFKLYQEVKALPYLINAKEGGYSSKTLDYQLGVAYHLSHDFDNAIKHFEKYRSTLKSNDVAGISEINRKIEYCKNGKELIQKPINVKIKNLGPGVNSPYPDYVPAISADESTLIFTSRRPNSTGGKLADDNHYYEDIYISVKSDTVWTTALQLSGEINTESHDACVAISPDGQKMFMYRNSGKDGGDLYVSKLIGSIWSSPENLGPNINSNYWEPSASINAEENVLFFTSDRKGGYGGRDIYMSKKLPSGEFGKPILLGPRINTPYDEDSPFIHADGKTLYFSSKGHKSMGGFDIFSCTIDLETGEVLTEPVNIGYPINTADDDVFFVWSADNKRAYFASVREGGYGEKDIYMLEREEADASLAVFKGTIQSCEGQTPVAATIIVTDNTTQEVVGVYNSNSSTGKYTVILPSGKNYGITVETPGYLFYSKNIDIPSLNKYQEILDIICLEKLKVGKKIVLRNVFFDVNKATLRKESQAELNRLVEILNTNPTMNIQISGHTDSDGNDDHNLKLSDARAKSVVEYLVSKGIDKKRLTYKGYGETMPVAPNDTPENKQLNRRTEIEIID
ncbi:MAG TPA: OmpA family protein [Cytophagaceae bacterium]